MKSFRPKSLKTLSEVDSADISYEDVFVSIEGVISPSGQCAWSGRSDEFDVHCFAFAYWCILGESLIQRELIILRPIPSSAERRDDEIFGQFPPFSIQRFVALLSRNHARAIINEELSVDVPNRQLVLYSARLRQPVILSTKRFGKLKLNQLSNTFDGKSTWDGNPIRVIFAVDKNGNPDDAIKTAERLWSQEANWKTQLSNFAIEELLELKNRFWLRKNEKEMTRKIFIARRRLVSIKFEVDGNFEFIYSDEKMFNGHFIGIFGSIEKVFISAYIQG